MAAVAISEHTTMRPVTLPCCVVDCDRPSHYGTATGLRFCVMCAQRYLLIEFAERLFPECLWSRDAVKRSALQDWIELVQYGDEGTILQAMQAFHGEMKCFNIDWKVL